MRLFSRTICVALAVVMIAAAGTATLRAGDDDDDDAGASAEAKAAAAAALAKAVAHGKELWNSTKDVKKSCATCHDSADKPNLNMATREWAYPAYSRRKRNVVTLHQKIQEMQKYNCRGPLFDDGGPDLAALAAYVSSLKK